jgi:hypothetical protein
MSELKQLHERVCFTPINVSELTPSERKKAMMALMLLTEKRDGAVKGRMVYNGKPSRDWLMKEDAASPTASLESILITGVIDAYEKRDVMTADVPNAFIQAPMPEVKPGDERVMMKITGVLVDMLVQLCPEIYGPYVVFEKGMKVLYVQVLRAIYGMLQAALLWYNKFKKDLEGQGFKFNPYDPCVANRMVKGKQHTIVFHVDDLKSSHKDKKVNDKFAGWLEATYGQHGKVKVHRGKIHDYLGMKLDFSEKKKLKVDMRDYLKEMFESFPIKFKKNDTAPTPAAEDLFGQKQDNAEKLSKVDAETFHTTTAQGLFLTKRARPDISTAIAYLCTRVREPTVKDWEKLIRMMKYLNGTRDMVLTLSADGLNVLKWYVDAAFAVHSDFKSHTGCVMTMGKGAIMSMSRKQKLNTKSSTSSELVGADDSTTLMLWTKLFMEEQGYKINENILYQDNKSTILLEKNGRKSAGKQSRALNVRYFFIADQVNKGNISVKYCPTGEMVGDYMSKPLQGKKFLQFRKAIMGT